MSVNRLGGKETLLKELTMLRSSCHHIFAHGNARRRTIDLVVSHQSFRSMSFKAFANRRNQNVSRNDNAAADKVEVKKTIPSSNEGGAFSNMIKRKSDGSKQQSWRSRPAAASFPSHDNDNSRSNWKSRSPTRSNENAPWQNNQQQGRRSNNEFSNNNNNYGSRNNTQDVIKQPSQLAGEDLKDITPLRNAFMKNTNQRQSWRSTNSSFSQPSAPTASSPDNSTSSRVGSTWRPSFYRKKEEPPPPNQGDDAAGNATSIEQVMKANSMQRKKDMEQRFLNAGEAVPFNVDEFGNARNSNGPMNWRSRPQQQQQQSYQNHRNQNNYRRNNQRYNQQRGPNRQSNFDRRRQNQQRQIRKHLPSSIPTTARLPSTPQTLVDFSLLLRVNKRTIVRTLRSLGESLSYNTANQDSFKIDVEMMELICIELGIEPTKTEKKMSVLEEAERRAMRQSSDASLDDEAKTEEEERYAALPPRSPVVSIMGHVDHGKTTLMDSLRRRAVTAANTPKGAGKASKKSKKKKGKKSDDASSGNVAGTEAGGITQVITAFEVPLPFEDGGDDSSNSPVSTVTFLDTPGHAAFKKMRQSGSSATDVIVLVVAADDGISPQTLEIIDMYKAIARSQPQSISLVIAVSKIDKPGIDIDEAVTRIENQLIEHDIFTENIGDEGEFGTCQLFPVSGITGDGLDDLIEGLALQSEMMDLRADDDAKGEGIVIDARMEKGLGVVADCVIRWGKVERGDFVVSGTTGGRVKFLNDVANSPLKKGRPSQPVRIVGFKSLPKAGDPIVCASSEDEAKEIIRLRESELNNEERADFENDVELQVTGTAAKQGLMLQRAQEKYGFDGDDDEDAGTIRIPVVIKADSHGALEAVRDALVSIGTDSKLDIIIDPVEMSTGVVTTSDVRMARESDAAIFCFGKVGIADRETKNLAETEEVSIRNHLIIYRLLEDAKDVFVGHLPVEYTTRVHGKANVQAVFEVTDKNKASVSVAGLRVIDGNLFKAKSTGEKPLSCFYRVLRNGDVVEGSEKLKSSSLRRVKEDVDSVKRGEECGLQLDGFNELEEGDVIECYSIEEKRVAI
mmetsp:Transcript_19772/g.39544  ORF Transcript_19772/g.39544 Transcript_19772/m.39544 type:complete len:1073 (-) Transcript_19772:43-3261(-)